MGGGGIVVMQRNEGVLKLGGRSVHARILYTNSLLFFVSFFCLENDHYLSELEV